MEYVGFCITSLALTTHFAGGYSYGAGASNMTGITIRMAAGATEADIQQALDKLPSGGTLVLAENQTILIHDGLSLNASSRSISLDLNGSTLQQAGDNAVIWVDGRMAPGAAAQLGTSADGKITVAYNGAAKVSVGDYVKI